MVTRKPTRVQAGFIMISVIWKRTGFFELLWEFIALLRHLQIIAMMKLLAAVSCAITARCFQTFNLSVQVTLLILMLIYTSVQIIPVIHQQLFETYLKCNAMQLAGSCLWKAWFWTEKKKKELITLSNTAVLKQRYYTGIDRIIERFRYCGAWGARTTGSRQSEREYAFAAVCVRRCLTCGGAGQLQRHTFTCST